MMSFGNRRGNRRGDQHGKRREVQRENRRKRITFLLCILLLTFVAGALPAIQHPNDARGFDVRKAYEIGEIDQVNVFNGNLSLTIPIGGTYSAGGGLDYGLTLVYNSKLWDWRVEVVDNGEEISAARPGLDFNAGFGWQLHLGLLFEPYSGLRNPGDKWLYVSPDGAEHVFYKRLHHDDPDTLDTYYTRDGSYLRLRKSGSLWHVESGDGSARVFEETNDGHRLKRLQDAWGNTVEVSYELAAWVLTDSTGRSHRIEFQTRTYDDGNVSVVDKVKLAAFDGQQAVYDFSYAQLNIRRPPGHDPRLAPVEMSAPVLTRVTLPEGGDFFIDEDWYRTTQDDVPSGPGLIEKLRLPTRGYLAWTWVERHFPTDFVREDDGSHNPAPPFLMQNAGVAVRQVLDTWGHAASWTYDVEFDKDFPWGNDKPAEERVTVTDPLGHRTLHFFSAYPGGGDGTPAPVHADPVDYGLPYSPIRLDEGLFLSRVVTPAAGGDKRDYRLIYDRDLGPRLIDGYGSERNVNHRVRSEATIYQGDGGKSRVVTRAGDTGLGRYRTELVTGDFTDDESRRHYTYFTPQTGRYPDDFTMLGAGEPWLLDVYSERWVEENGQTEKREACFNSQGAMTRERIFKLFDGDRHKDDVIRTFTYYTNGFVKREKYHGGDLQGQVLGVGALCGLPLPSPSTEIEHTWQHGTMATSKYVGADHYLLDRTIDRDSGLPSQIRDISGLETDLEWDRQGRLVWEKPEAGHGARKHYAYTFASGQTEPTRAKVYIRELGNSGTGLLSESQLWFDHIGRLWKEQRRIPGHSTFLTKEYTYNALNWLTVESEWQTAETPGGVTRYNGYDAYGRPQAIVPPEGSSKAVTFKYFGDRIVNRKYWVGTHRQPNGYVGQTQFTTTETRDVFGRLVEVDEPAGGLLARYEYDVGNRLWHAKLEGSVNQHRWFNYDGRGFLTREVHPESGATHFLDYDARGKAHRQHHANMGLKDLKYEYDEAERLTAIRDRNRDAAYLKRWFYAGSNLGVNKRKGKLERAVHYNHRKVPWAPTVWIDFAVEETFAYAGVGGRISSKKTTVGDVFEFDQSWTYTDLGLPKTISYPRCQHQPCSASPGPPRTVTRNYSLGELTSVAGFASMQYQDNGMLFKVNHTNGTIDTIWKDLNNRQRPRNIQVTLPSEWTAYLGLHDYDGSGNLVRRVQNGDGGAFRMGLPQSEVACGGAVICENYYLYDGPGRLRHFNDAAGLWQSYNYDTFGNLTSVTDFDGSTQTTRNISVSATNNRLNSPVVYDGMGRIKSRNVGWTESYTWDAFDHMATHNFPQESHIYTTDGERVHTLRYVSGEVTDTLTLRDLDGRVLTEYETDPSGNWSWKKDYIYRSEGLLSTISATEGRRDHHLDHLGTPRLVTSAAGQPLEDHHYFGFGEEFGAFAASDEKMRFTGHERDKNAAGAVDDLDYMHARYYSPMLGRFLSVDPARSEELGIPQSWNRYGYSLNNPLRYVDPDGRRPSETVNRVGSVTAGFLPVMGEIQDASIALTGVDPITFEKQTTAVRVLAAVAIVIPIVGGKALGELFGLGKQSDEAAGLQKQLGSESQAADLLAEGGEAFAGAGTSKVLGDAPRLAAQYGGEASDWAKVRSQSFSASDGTKFEIHAYKNVQTGEIVEMKTKIVVKNAPI